MESGLTAREADLQCWLIVMDAREWGKKNYFICRPFPFFFFFFNTNGFWEAFIIREQDPLTQDRYLFNECNF